MKLHTFAVLFITLLTACAESHPLFTPVESGSAPVEATQLAPLVVEACQYGGTYPFCKPPPPPTGEGSPPPTGPDGTSVGQPGGTAEPDTTTIEPPCETDDAIINAPEVQDGFGEIWNASNYSPTTPQEQRREAGGWIISTGTGYSFQPFQNADLMPCGVDIPADGKPANAVAFVHTHPWAVGEKQTSCPPIMIGGRAFYEEYKGNSTIPDDKAAAALGLPGYILDADGITKFDGTGATLARHRRCGY